MNTYRDKTLKAPEMKLRGDAGQIRFPALACRKWDGEYNVLHHNPRRAITRLVNKYGLVREDCPALDMVRGLGRQVVLIGELVWAGGKAGTLYGLNAHKTDDRLEFKPFDIGMLDGEDITHWPLSKRLRILAELVPSADLGEVVRSREELDAFYRSALEAGYEGIVVKDPRGRLAFGSSRWAKVKKKDRTRGSIILIDPVKDRIEVALEGGGRCAVKVMSRIKRTLRVGGEALIEHQGFLARGSVRHPVFVER